MKGLSMTLTIVIVAIVLLVTALVIMTIFGAQMAQVVGILNPWSTSMLESNLCQQKCATWCQLNPGESGVGWATLQVQTQDNREKKCDDIIMVAQGASSVNDIGKCNCGGLPGTR